MDLLAGKGYGEAFPSGKAIGNIPIQGLGIAGFDDIVSIHIGDIFGLGYRKADIGIDLVNDVAGKADHRGHSDGGGFLLGLYPINISAGPGGILESRIQACALQESG